jgi:hypothetical protein
MGVLLLSCIPPIPTLVLSTLASYTDKVDKLYFKCEMGIRPSIYRLE